MKRPDAVILHYSDGTCNTYEQIGANSTIAARSLMLGEAERGRFRIAPLLGVAMQSLVTRQLLLFPAAEQGKQNHFTDGRFVGEKHDEAVDAHTEPAVGRHAVFHRA
jgi:hypothetical protein